MGFFKYYGDRTKGLQRLVCVRSPICTIENIISRQAGKLEAKNGQSHSRAVPVAIRRLEVFICILIGLDDLDLDRELDRDRPS